MSQPNVWLGTHSWPPSAVGGRGLLRVCVWGKEEALKSGEREERETGERGGWRLSTDDAKSCMTKFIGANHNTNGAH